MRLKISIRMLHYWFEEQKIEHRSKITEEQYEIYGIRYEQYDKDQDHYAVVYDARSLRGFTDYQTIICHKNNMIDNVMLGRYSQTALTGAATVNQIFFMVDQFALAIGNALVALSSQYWGAKKLEPIRKLTGTALRLGLICSIIIVILCILIPEPLLHIFTTSLDVIAEARQYLSIVQWTFVLFILTNILMAVLRSVGTVRISVIISVVSLIINAILNYLLIFGKCGFPELGIRGAAIATLVARIIEFAIVVIYIWKTDKKLQLFSKELFHVDREMRRDYRKICVPIMFSQVLWGISVPMQTAILGHLSTDAIAANSVATTFYQYLKVIVLAMSSTSAVLISNEIGKGDKNRIKSDARTLSVIDVSIGVILGIALILLRKPLLSFYSLSGDATEMALHLIVIMGFVMIGMSYQMPVSFGIIQGSGNAGFTMKMNLISVWVIVMPLSFMAAFWWKLPVEAVVLVIQSDQIFKCVPTFIRFRSYKWITKLTRQEPTEETI